MDTEERRKRIERELADRGTTLPAWAREADVSMHIVTDLIEGRLLGTRGVPLQVRRKMEKAFGKIF